MKIDVVYKLGHGSKYFDEELKYSLRSLSYFLDLGKVFIVGHRPNWITNIIYIPANDPYRNNKDANLINKLILACCHKDISDKFLNMSDDIIFLNNVNCDFFDIPIINNKHINFIPGQKLNRWHSRLKRTIDALKSSSLRFDCYEAHCPYLLDKSLFTKTMLRYDYGVDIGYCGNTLYYNTNHIIGKDEAFKYVCPVMNGITYEKIKNESKNKLFLNFNEKGFNEDMRKFLKEKFKEQSIYEQ